MRNSRRFKFGPLVGFSIVSLLGFIFFTSSLILLWIYSDIVDEFLKVKYKKQCKDLLMFIILSAITAFGFLITFFQLIFSKATSKKVLVPIVFFTSVAFVILIALDFYLEVQLTHLPPKVVLTKTEPDEEEGKMRLKIGFLSIYVPLCVVAGFVYLGVKDFEDHLEKQKAENERQQEIIIISHIT